ncbi:MAG: TRAP transporter large permease subunit [Oscillospiraceae bacterium]|jgi:Na+/H+ antiporter NhaD/arsenite permease-like protein|nr:TRAP transporter large permease subunit [Oscillospiraceae bacterium]
MQWIAERMGETTTMWVALGLFAATYLGLMIFSKARAYIALGAAALFVLLGIIPLGKVPGAVDWNVILMIAGTMGTVTLFIESRMPAKMADWLIEKSPNLKWAVIWLSVFAGVISAFVDNVATVLMIAPVAVGIAKKLKVSPVPAIIAISIASNLEGAATLVGDTTSILLAGAAKLNFLDFFFYRPPGAAHYGVGLFWIVQVAFVAATAVLFVIFRKDKQPIHLEERETVRDYMPTALLLGTVISLILVSFVPSEFRLGSLTLHKPAAINGIICVGIYLIGVLWYGLVKRNKKIILITLKELDYFTLLLLAGLFVVIGGLEHSGVVREIGELFAKIANGNAFLIYTILVWFSMIISAFVDNIPYVATMLPVVTVISTAMGISPAVLYFGLLSGATLGGNLTPIGASANIAALGILRKEGHQVKAKAFMKISVPYTLAACLVGYGLVWVFWSGK